MGLTEGLPANVRITSRAQKDLTKLLKKDPKNFAKVWNDVKRLAQYSLPQMPKSLKGFTPPLWQVDSGDFRIFHTWEDRILWLRGILRKSEQAKRIKGIR